MKNIPLRQLQKTQQEPDFSGSFVIKDLKDLMKGEDLVQELHRHDFFFILALQKGTGTHEIDFTPYKVGNYSIFFLRPGQVHQLTLSAKSNGYLIQFKTDFYYPEDKLSRQLLRIASNKNLCSLDPNRFKNLIQILNNIFQEYTQKRERYQEVIKANMGIFFIELLRNQQKDKSHSSHAKAYEQERLEEFLQMIEAHVSNHKEVSFYIEKLNLSAYQLNAITKATMGKTSSELIIDYILLESKRLLLATTNQVSQIAYHLGYEDVSYFIRFFKKHTGFTPEMFRRSSR